MTSYQVSTWRVTPNETGFTCEFIVTQQILTLRKNAPRLGHGVGSPEPMQKCLRQLGLHVCFLVSLIYTRGDIIQKHKRSSLGVHVCKDLFYLPFSSVCLQQGMNDFQKPGFILWSPTREFPTTPLKGWDYWRSQPRQPPTVSL